jgi:hypothetical protein
MALGGAEVLETNALPPEFLILYTEGMAWIIAS